MGVDVTKHKVLFVGPIEAGKSTLANVLAENTDSAAEIYRPTQGVRILEFEGDVQSVGQHVTIELWDVSGDTKYAKCWPAIKQDAVGCVLVYNPERQSDQEEIEKWYQWFPKTMNLTNTQVLVIQSLSKPDSSWKHPLPAKLKQLSSVVVGGEDLVCVRASFDKYLDRVLQSVMEKQRKDEDEVMQG